MSLVITSIKYLTLRNEFSHKKCQEEDSRKCEWESTRLMHQLTITPPPFSSIIQNSVGVLEEVKARKKTGIKVSLRALDESKKLAELCKCLLCITSIAAIDCVKSESHWHKARLKEIYVIVQYFLRWQPKLVFSPSPSFFFPQAKKHLCRSVTQTEASDGEGGYKSQTVDTDKVISCI